MNLLRAFSTGGYAGLDRIREWNLDFMDNTPEGAKYLEVARRIDESVQFMHVRSHVLLLKCHLSANAIRPHASSECHTAQVVRTRSSSFYKARNGLATHQPMLRNGASKLTHWRIYRRRASTMRPQA